MIKPLSDAKRNALYGKAEALLGVTGEALVAQGLLAHEHRRNGDAMRVLSFVWGRNARHLAVAVSRWPHYFMPTDGVEPPALEPDEVQTLFMLAALPKGIAEELHTKWRRYSWRAWRVREEVEDWRTQQKDPRLLRLRVRGGKVSDVVTAEASAAVTVQWAAKDKTLPKLTWQGKTVDLLITERKGE